MKRHFILDGDYGVDDALAALYLASEPDIAIVAVGSVHGNTSAEQAARNAAAVLDLAGLDRVPVAMGAARPLVQAPAGPSAAHGEDGLGGAVPDGPAGERLLATQPAAVQLVEAVRAHPRRCTVLATGPLTNLALALLLAPEVVELVERVVVMGGSLGHQAETNLAHDPEAAEVVLTAGWPVTVVGLDVTMSTWLRPDELRRLESADSPRARFAWSALQPYLASYESRYGRRSCPLHDPTAARLAVDPSLATYLETGLRVELRSPDERGRLRVVETGPAVRVAKEMDRDRVVAGILDGLTA